MSNNKELINIIRLTRTANIGPITFYRLIEQFGFATKAIAYLPEIGHFAKKKIEIYSVAKAEEELALAEKHNAKIIAFNSTDYPPLLKHIPDAPPILFVKGNINLLKKTAIAIVGSRNASINGKNKAYTYATQLGEHGFVVISGLAKGIDTAAHEGSLAKGTIAVLGNGLDTVYPTENLNLQNKIAEYGCLVSEVPFFTPAIASNFPKRNRIISGISRGCLVIEAGQNSGSLITAKLALDQNREVFAIPGDIEDSRNTGSNTLIQMGQALLVQNINDIIKVLKQNSQMLQENHYKTNTKIDYTTIARNDIEQAKQTILDSMGFSAVNTDILLNQSKINYNTFTIALLELEITGHIQRTGNNCVVKIN